MPRVRRWLGRVGLERHVRSPIAAAGIAIEAVMPGVLAFLQIVNNFPERFRGGGVYALQTWFAQPYEIAFRPVFTPRQRPGRN